jgi:D-methionine transport system ATP-binding protein
MTNQGGNTKVKLSSFLTKVDRMKAFYYGLFARFGKIKKKIERGGILMAVIELKNVERVYNFKASAAIHAVDHVNLTIEKGDVFGIVGYSGAGKSTLVRLLNGLELPTAGEVLVNGQDVDKLKKAELRNFRKKIGMIFQHFNLLWSRTVQKNIELPLELAGVSKAARRKKVAELLTLVGLEGRGNAYPAQLSGGQKQRVGIARALANDPEILLCDEATSALDPQTTDEVLELLADINKKMGLTVVLITHEMNVIRKICNKVAVMELGKVVEEGLVKEVFRNPQQEVTKRFVRQDSAPDEDFAAIVTEIIKANPEGQLVQLDFNDNNANEPIISQAIRQFPVDINVLHANIQRADAHTFGTLIVQLLGEDQQVQAATNFFKEKQVVVEVISRG